ncbi:hypothetical protein [Aestuariivirga sp.]|uniref:hypothetical protein n=1 Tax=Aestuariivirga sp. TaxID=2650926 RepID=UPI003BAD1B85
MSTEIAQIGEQTLSPVAPRKPQAKGDATTDAARAILRAEVEHQHAKTARLRAARLAFEAQQPKEIPGSRARPLKPKTKKRAAAASAPKGTKHAATAALEP